MFNEPTRDEVAHYRTMTKRNELLREVRAYLDALPHGDLATAERALEWLRSPVKRTDLRYAAGRFYILGDDALWTMDDESNGRTTQLMQGWAERMRPRGAETYDRELRAAHAAPPTRTDDGGQFADTYDNLRKWFDKATRGMDGPRPERTCPRAHSDRPPLDGRRAPRLARGLRRRPRRPGRGERHRATCVRASFARSVPTTLSPNASTSSTTPRPRPRCGPIPRRDLGRRPMAATTAS